MLLIHSIFVLLSRLFLRPFGAPPRVIGSRLKLRANSYRPLRPRSEDKSDQGRFTTQGVAARRMDKRGLQVPRKRKSRGRMSRKCAAYVSSKKLEHSRPMAMERKVQWEASGSFVPFTTGSRSSKNTATKMKPDKSSYRILQDDKLFFVERNDHAIIWGPCTCCECVLWLLSHGAANSFRLN